MATNTTWNGSTDNWDTAADWDNGLPGVNSIALITSGQPEITSTTNAGTIAGLTVSGALVFDDGALTVNGAVQNTGTIALDQGFAQGESTLTISGALTNSYRLQVGPADSSLSATDTVKAASIDNTGGTINLYGASSSVIAELDITGTAGAAFDAATGQLTGSVNLNGNSKVVFEGDGEITDIAANSELSLGGANGATDSIQDGATGATNSALTGLAQVEGALYLYNGASIITTGALNNSGTIDLDQGYATGGAQLTIKGALTNSNYLQVGTSGNTLTASDTVKAASINNTGGKVELYGSSSSNVAELDITGAAAFDATAGQLVGNVDLGGYSKVVFEGGGEITDIAAGGELSLGGANGSSDSVQDGATGATNSALTGLAQIEGGLYLYNGASITTTGALNNAGTLDLDQGYATGGAQLTIKGALTNSNYIQVGTGGNTLTANDTLKAASVNNTGGTVDLFGSSLSIVAELDITGAAAFDATSGQLIGAVNLGGYSKVVFEGGGQITDIAASSSLSLGGANGATDSVQDGATGATNSALTGLAQIEGALYLYNGASITTTGALTNTGTIDLDLNYQTGGAQLTIKGALTNSNYIQVGTSGDTLTANDTLKAASLNNTGGEIQLFGATNDDAELDITGAATFNGTAGQLVGQVNLVEKSQVIFEGGGEITDITGGSELSLDTASASVQDGVSGGYNSALTGLAQIEGSLYLYNGAAVTTSGALINTGHIYLDQNYLNGGAQLTVKGALTNDDNIQVGTSGDTLTADDTIKAASLNNSGGTINLYGSAADTAEIDLTSAAEFDSTAGQLVGDVNLNVNAKIIFEGGGEITDIVSGSELSLSGLNTSVQDGAAGANNSALTGLAQVQGGLYLYNGSIVTTSGALTNTGTIFLDQSYLNGGAQLTVKGALTNSDSIQIGTSGNTLSADDTLKAASFNNAGGEIQLFGSSSNVAELDVTGAASFGASADELVGQVNLAINSKVVFEGGGEITDIISGSELSLTGVTTSIQDGATGANNSALTGLAQVQGGLYLYNGSVVTTNGALTNTGTIDLDQSYLNGGAQLTIKGALTNSNYIQVGTSGETLSADDTLKAASVNNTGGEIQLFGSSTHVAELDIAGAATFGPSADELVGQVNLSATSKVVFEGGGEIANIISGSELSLAGAASSIQDGASGANNSALTGLKEVDGGLYLYNGANVTANGALTNKGTIDLDQYYQNGGSQLTVKGLLTNSGNIDVGTGNGGNSANMALNVGSLLNTGTITLLTGLNGQAKLTATTSIENSGNLNVYFYSNVTAASFQQDQGGEVTLELQGTTAATHGTISASGGVTLEGGTLYTPPYNYSASVGETFNLITFKAGDLVGMFNNVNLFGVGGDGAYANIGNNMLAGLEYDDNAGVIEEKVVATPASLNDSWTGASADWSTTADWSNGAPDFYSAVTISTSAAATVTLSSDKTIDSLNLAANDTLTTKTGTDLSIGAGLTNAGKLNIGGEAFVDGVAANTGSITVTGSVLDVRGAVTGAGGFTIGPNAELEFGSSDAETVTFNGASATLKLDNPASFSGTLANMVVGDEIDLAGITVVSPTTNGATLTFKDSNNNAYSYTLTGFPSGAGFKAQSDGAGGTVLVVTPPTGSVTLSPIDGNNVINSTEAHNGITVGGNITGLAVGASFALNVVDGAVSKTYVATVLAGGATWTASIPATDLTTFPDGSASFTAYVNATTQASQTVVVREALPTVTINQIDGNNIIDKAQATAGVVISGSSTGLLSGATFNVKVVDGSFSKTYVATVGSNGAWTATIPPSDATTMPNGVSSATVSAQATDAYGNLSATATQTVTVEETLPTVTINSVDGDNVINHAQAAAGVTITGGSSGLASGSTFQVTLTDGSFSKSYTATVGASGAWTAAVPSTDATTLGNGANALTVSAQPTDAYGNVAAKAADLVTVAGNVPTLAISAVDVNNVINHAEAAAGVTITGTSTGLATAATFQITLTDGAFSKSYTATISAGGGWSATVPAADATTLANGTASLSAQTSDAYGNPTNNATDNVTVQETLPTVTIAKIDGDNVINDANASASGGVAISGASTGLATNSTFLVSVVDGSFSKTYTATVGAGGAWTATIPSSDALTLPNGAATVSAQATDAYGNVSTLATQSVTVEEIPPTLTIAKIDMNNVINYAEAHATGGVAISGISTGLAANSTFTVDVVDGSFSKTYTATVGTGGAWTATIPSADAVAMPNGVGVATVSAQATDAYGNVSAIATQTVTVEETLPTIAINAIDTNNVINYAEAHASGGVAISGTSTGLAANSTFTVKVVDGSFSKTYTATVGTGGAWTATIPSSDAVTMPNGVSAATFTAQVTDAYGNVSATATQSVTVEETLPTVTISPVEGNNIITPTEAAAGVAISGTSTGLASGATFQLKLTDGTFSKSYTATVGSGGAWSASVPASDATQLASGMASLSAQATDAYGNVSAAATDTVTVQGNMPTLTISPVDTNNIINHAQAAAGVTITGTSTGLATGATFSVTLTDGTFSKGYTATVGANGAWSATVPASDATTLANGTASLSAQAIDAHGDSTNVATDNVTVQETPPTVTIAKIDGNDVINYAEAHASGGVAISGASTGLASGATFTISVVDGTFSKTYAATVGTGGAWTATIPSSDAVTLSNGTATVSAHATDTYGNVSAIATQTVTVEETLPTVTIAKVDGNDVINSAEAHASGGVAISGASTGLASGATFTISVVDGTFSKTYTATVGTGGAWTATIPSADAVTMPNGVNAATVSAQVTDAYGNISTIATQTVTVEETLPTVTIAKIDGNDVINSAEAHASGGVAISGASTGLASGSTFTISVVDGTFSKTYTATVGTGGAWTATIPSSDAVTLANGTGTVSAYATDAYGNVSATATQSVTVEETLPTVTIAKIDSNDVINNTEAHASGGVAIAGTSTGLASGSTFAVSVVDGTFSKTYMATVGTGGAWTATIPSSDAVTLANGTATVSAQATDAYGNVSAVATQTVTVEETLPTVTIAKIDGDDVINSAEAHASGGVAISGASTGLASGSTFTVSVVDGAFSKTYTATVGTGGAWTATIPSSDAVTLANGTATFTAQATDAYGNVSATATQTVTVNETAAVTLNPVDGNSIINYAEAHAAGGVALSGTISGAAVGATFSVSVVDGVFNKTYTATVGANGVWTATIPMSDAKALADGSAVITATVSATETAFENVTVAETQPTLTGITESPATGDFDAGNLVTLTLTTSAPVNVTGAPTITLNDGETATYDKSKSTSTSLVFDYTVQAGDNTTKLRADAVNLSGGTIDDVDGNAVLLSLGGLSQKGPEIDTTAPVFVGVTESPSTGMIGVGKSVTIDVFSDEAVTVGGAPTLTLNDGGTATYVAGSSTSTKLVFKYTVAAGQSTPDLQATSLNLSGGSIVDLAGNVANLSLANITQVGPDVSGVAPTITAVMEAPATGDLDAGKTVTLTLTVSESVTVTGTPKLTLNDGGTATYDATNSTSTSLVFDYTVAAGQNTAALQVSSVSGGSIKDAFGNAANLSLTGLTQKGPQIDTTAPTFTAVTDTPATGDLDAGKTVTITLTASEPVAVTGAPTLTLNDGGVATYDTTKSTSTSLVFDYTVAAGQNTAALKVSAVGLNGGTIDDLAGNAAKQSLSGLTQTGPQIDTTAPKFTKLVEQPATGDLDAGATVALILTSSEAVIVTGKPTLTLNDDGVATYDSGKSTSTSLVFDCTVAAGQNTTALKATGVNLAGGTIDDLAGNAADLTITSLGQTGPKIDTTAPTFIAVKETPATGDLGVGKTVTIALTASEAVAVTGAPTLTLNDGGVATYDATASTTTKLVFDYTVGAGQTTSALAVNAVNLSGGTIDDLAGNAAVLSLAGLVQTGPQIDTTPPAVVGVSGSPSSGDLVTGQTEIIAVKTSEAVKVTGSPQLILNDGGDATYATGSGTNTLTFDYKVLAGQSTTDLQIVGVDFPANTGVTDLAGNPLFLPASTVNLGVGVNNFVTLSGNETYEIAGAANQSVVFASGASADLILTDSQQYTGQISGLATTDTLDLRDLQYGSATQASYSGTTTGGTLTVTDGTHEATIALLGNYLSSTFTASNDGYGGVSVVDPMKSALSAPHALG